MVMALNFSPFPGCVAEAAHIYCQFKSHIGGKGKNDRLISSSNPFPCNSGPHPDAGEFLYLPSSRRLRV